MTTTTGVDAELPPIGFLLRELDRLIDERFEATLGRRHVTRRQWQLLSTLARGEATLSDLTSAVAPFLDHAAGEEASLHLAPLLERGLVQQVGERCRLTAAGDAAVEVLAAEVAATRALTVAGVAPADYAQTVRTLQAMITNLARC